MSHKHTYLSLVLLLVLAGSTLGQDEPPVTEDKPSNPSPANGAVDVPVNTIISWNRGNYAHQFVWFGTAPGAGLHFLGNQREKTSYNLDQLEDQLEPNTTYYWRIQEIDTHGKVTLGPVWSFTTGDRIVLPQDGWKALSPDGVYEVPVIDGQVALNYEFAAELNNSQQGTKDFYQHLLKPLDLSECDNVTFNWTGNEGNDRVRICFFLIDTEGSYGYSPILDPEFSEGSYTWTLGLDDFSGEGGLNGLDSICVFILPTGKNENYSGTLYIEGVYFWSIPENASGPNPLDGAQDVATKPTLSWIPGSNANKHDIYIGTDKDAVNKADTSERTDIYQGRSSKPSLGFFSSLEPNKTYYWRIDEVDSEGKITKGQVWSFTTGDFLVIDDFENYDVGDKPIWEYWNDGLGFGVLGFPGYIPGNGTGSALGDENSPSYTEEAIIHGGSQSMPVQYDNNKQGFAKYSEVERTLTDQRDWTEEGVSELSIWFRGYPGSVGSFVEGPVGTYTMTRSGAVGYGHYIDKLPWDGGAVARSHEEYFFAHKMLSGPGSITARVDSLDNTNDWAKAGVMIRETLDPNSAHAFVCITPGNGVAFQGRPKPGDSSFSTNQAGIAAPYWVKIERDLAGNFTAYHSSSGSTWVQLGTWENIQMATNVHIGLAVTSHDAALTCQAVFSNVTTSDAVSGAWMSQGIGIPRNDPESLYVALYNNTGPPAVVVHPDPQATLIDTWAEWRIPLDQFAEQGIDLTHVNSIGIGLGTWGNMTIAGGSGKMYIDDIRLYRPRVVPSEMPLIPKPDDGQTGIWPGRPLRLSWSGTNTADISHNVYVGKIFDFVENADTTATGIFRGNQKDTHYDVSGLVPSTTYYWRVDEIAYDGTTHKGDVWRFTTAEQIPDKILREVWSNVWGERVDDLRSNPRFPDNPDFTELADWLSAPRDSGDNYGQRFSGYLKPPVTGEYTFWISSDDNGEFWLSIDDDPSTRILTASVPGWTDPYEWDKYPKQQSEQIRLLAGEKYYMEALMKEGRGGDNLAVAWLPPGGTREIISAEYVELFPGSLLSANMPNPANGQTDVDQELNLEWNASDNVLRHRVFFGHDFTEVMTAEPYATFPEYKGRQTGTTFDPGSLEWGMAYYWRVDEEITDGTVQKGPVWSFSTADFFKIDDFEDYDDNVAGGTTVFHTWVDGWVNGTDSQVGGDSSLNGTFCETEIVHTGSQSMPLFFNMQRPGSTSDSRADRTFTPAFDLTVNGMDTLTLFVRGQADNDPAQLYVGLKTRRSTVYVPFGDPTIVQSTSWVEVSIPLADFAPVKPGAVDGMFIRLGEPGARTRGNFGVIYIDDIRATKSAD